MITDINSHTWDELEAMDVSQMTYILPISSLEQHGKHLTLGADDFILSCAMEELYTKDVAGNLLVLPTIHYGNSHEHIAFRGVVSISCNTIVSMVRDVLGCMQMHGIKKLVVINSHGGNTALLEAYAQEWEVEFGVKVYTISIWSPSFFQGAELGVETPLSVEIHAGEMETSILQNGMPHMVRQDKISTQYDTQIELKPYYAGWSSADLSPGNGTMGVASLATPEKGKTITAYMGNKMAQYLTEIQQNG